MDPILTHILTFSLGLLSASVLLWIQDKRQVQRTISREVYKPLHEELFAICPLIESAQRTGFDGSLWKRIQAAGNANSISNELFEELEGLYRQTIPNYDNAWFAARDKTEALTERWDAAFGRPPGPAAVKDVNWQKLLTNAEFCLPQIQINANEALRLRNNCIHAQTLQIGQLTVEQFVRQRWDESRNEAEFEDFRAQKTAALAHANRVRAALLKRIRP